MKAPLPLFILVLAYFTTLNANAQDISVNTKKIQPGYQTDLTKSFKISFTNNKKNADLKVTLVTDDQGSPLLKKGVDTGTFSIPFVVTKGKLAVNNTDGKAVPLTGSFSILYDTHTFKVSQKTPAIVINMKKPPVSDTADFTKNFDIQFTNATKGAKTPVTLIFNKTTSTLETTLPVSSFTLQFKSDSGKVTTSDAKGKTVTVTGPFTINFAKTSVAIKSKTVVKPTVTAGGETADATKKAQVPFWSYLKGGTWSFSLDAERKLGDGDCPTKECASCEDKSFDQTNQLVYDAKSGLTYYVPSGSTFIIQNPSDAANTKFVINHKNKAVMSAGDPLVLVIKNVNPALYDVTLSDSVLLTNNQSNALLETLLLGKAESAPTPQPTAGAAAQDATPLVDAQKDMITVKAALLVVQAEMERTIAYYRTSNLYLHNCIAIQKKAALVKIDNSLKGLIGTSYDKYSFLQMVNLFLDQSTVDSTANHQIKALYGEFIAANYTIASRLAPVPEQDMLFLKLAIVAKKDCPYPSLLAPVSQRPTQTIYIKDFFKVDVSSGLYYGFGKDQNYSLASRTSTTVKTAAGGDSTVNRLYKENDGSGEMGFASYLHLYQKWSPNVNGSLTVGAGLSLTQTVRPRYFTGLSLLLGANNRLCLTGGAMWGQFQQLSDQYNKTNGVYDDLPVTQTTINYKSTFKGTGFFAITYNLAFLKRTTN